MADQQTLDSVTPPQSDDQPHSQSSSSDPSLSRTLSSSRLNASAPEFVPGRTTPPFPQPRMMIPPPPPPPGLLRMYHHHPPPPFRVPIPPPPHLIPGPRRFPHHQNRQYAPFRNQSHRDYQTRGGDHEADVTGKKADHDRRRDYKRDSNKDQAEIGVSVAIDPKSGLPEDTVRKIVKQVEYYFSDLNLATTDHLIRFISKDREGYVPMHVVASFKKIKSIINSDSQLAIVLQNSSKLAVSEDGKKVRRIHPITESALEELQSRIVIAENLPEDHCYQNLMKIFSAVGSVKNIRTCQPQNSGSGPASAARSAKTDFSNKVHAFVEYEIVELAEKSVAELNEVRNRRNGLRVWLMLQHQEPKHVLQERGRKEEDDVTTTSEQQRNDKQFEDWDGYIQEQTVGEEEQEGEKRKGRNRGRGKGRGRIQNHQNQNSNQNHQNHNHNGGRGNHHSSNNPMINIEQPSMVKQQQQQPPPGPRMPDGTRGFSLGRGKPVPVQAE